MKNRSAYHLPLSSLQWLLGGLFLAALPLWFQLSPFVLFGFLGCLVWRLVLERKGLTCPRIWARLAVGVGGLGGLLLLHGTLLGLTAGMGLLLLLLGLKVLELRTSREFLLLSFLGFFINLTALFFAQSMLTCLYVAAVFLVLLAGVIHYNSGSSEGYSFWPLLRYAGLLILQATPLVLVLFFLLPRMKGGFMLRLNQASTAQTGMSDQINPGSFAELALSDELAFRADFPEGNMPSPSLLYWRVAVMSECHGLSWRKSPVSFFRPSMAQVSGPRIVQRISMEPHGGLWVYALDRPLSADGPTSMGEGNCLTLRKAGRDRLPPLRVTSVLGNDRAPLSAEARRMLTLPPETVSQRTLDLVNGWRAQTAQPRDLARLAFTYFRKERFRYTLSPGTYDKDGLDDFLFNRRLGFCEHYATAFATLMRLADIPSRVVAGYHGGEYNPLGAHLTVRQSEAHAWTELWINQEGWVRFDPAEAVDPARIDPGTRLATRQAGGSDEDLAQQFERKNFLVPQALFRAMRLAWDSLNYEWNFWVLGYDFNMQRDFYRQLGILQLLSWKLFGLVFGGLLLAVALVWVFVRQPAPKRDPLLHLYRRHCANFAALGLPRNPAEGPSDYAHRLAAHWPGLAEPILESFEVFIQARYRDDTEPATRSRLRWHVQEVQKAISREAGPRRPRQQVGG